jgi:hypothetical protein
MMTLYAFGFMAVFTVFGLMYFHAYRKRKELKLNEEDVFYALEHVGVCAVMVLASVASIIVAQTAPLRWAAFAAGFTYFIIGPAQWVRGVWMHKKKAEIIARALG